MPRDSGGAYTLVSGNPVVSGTIIASTWANTTMDDLANEMTDSLSRSGNGAMLAPLKNTQGSESNPSSTFGGDPLSGLYLGAVSDVRMSVNATDQMRWLNNQTEIWNEVDQEWYAVISTRDNVADVETQPLIAGQTEVTFVNNVAGAAIFINGVNADNGRLVSGVDYTYDSGAKILTLTESRPAGTLVTAQRAGGFDPETAVTPVLYDTEAALAAADIPVGTWATTKGKLIAGDGFGADWLITPVQALVGRDLTIANGNIAVFQTDIVTKSSRVNFIQNGDLSVWQRGTDFTFADANYNYSADRFYSKTSGSSSRDVDQIAGLVHEFGVRLTANIAVANFFGQKIEGKYTCLNKLITITAKVLVSATASNVRLRFLAGDAGGGFFQENPFVPTGSLQTITWTLTPNNHTDALDAWACDIGADLGIGDVIEWHEFQIEQGQTATEFEYINAQQQLADCQRYYEKGAPTISDGSYFNGDITNASPYRAKTFFKVEKRGLPQVIVTPTFAAGFSNIAGTIETGVLGFNEARTSTTTGAAGSFFGSWTADAEL